MIREKILQELNRRDKTRYWLAGVSGVSKQRVYPYLSGTAEMTTANLEKICEVLGLELRGLK